MFTKEQNEVIDFATKLAETVKVHNCTPSVDADEDKLTVGFPDRGYESEKASSDMRDTLESEYPDAVDEWLIGEPMDREGFRAFSIEGWWKEKPTKEQK